MIIISFNGSAPSQDSYQKARFIATALEDIINPYTGEVTPMFLVVKSSYADVQTGDQIPKEKLQSLLGMML